MRVILQKCGAVAFLLFVILWVAGIGRSFTLPYPDPVRLPLSFSSEEDYSARVTQQWANNLKQIGLADSPLLVALDQPNVDKIEVFEKNAHLTAGSAAFEEDVSQIRSAFTRAQAVVFHEKDTGIAPARRLSIEVGVNPEKFDALVEQLRAIGQLQSISVQQRDRTSEFRKLNAQRQSLKRYLQSIEKLRGVAKSSLDDSLKLEQKVQDIEKEMQSLGVHLGDLVGKESYYHVFVTLQEFQPGSRKDHSFTLPQRVGHGFVWAIAWWSATVVGAGVIVGTWVSVRILRPTTNV